MSSKVKLDGKTYELTNTDECVAYWSAIASKDLVGKTVTKVRYMTEQEMEAHGWYSRCVIIEFNDGTMLYPSQDDEGNGAGAMFGQKGKRDLVMPVI